MIIDNCKDQVAPGTGATYTTQNRFPLSIGLPGWSSSSPSIPRDTIALLEEAIRIINAGDPMDLSDRDPCTSKSDDANHDTPDSPCHPRQ
jgi:hypothetical protein